MPSQLDQDFKTCLHKMRIDTECFRDTQLLHDHETRAVDYIPLLISVTFEKRYRLPFQPFIDSDIKEMASSQLLLSFP